MASIYIASSHIYAGKTLLGLALARRAQETGISVGYFKPLGNLPRLAGNGTTDEDVRFIKETLNLAEPIEELCPIVLTEELIREELTRDSSHLKEQVAKGFQQISAGKDFVIVGGAGQSLSRGASLGLTGPQIAELLDLPVMLIAKAASLLDLDEAHTAIQAFGPRLHSVVLNQVPPEKMEFIDSEIIPRLRTSGLNVLGALPEDILLHSISVAELADSLNGKILVAAEKSGELVENFRVGAMTIDSALAHFRQVPRKAVITGGDRSDIVLAALQTDTTCIILTGGLPPSPAIRVRAEELGVPLLLVKEDTITAVDRVDELMTHLRVREPRKLGRAQELIEDLLDLSSLDALAGAARQ